MRPGRELDCSVAQEVLGHEVYVKNRVLHERTPEGDRPLRHYTQEIQWAWEVAERANISLIPIENGSWFALAGTEFGWKSPAEFITYLQSGDFLNSGAAVGPNPALMICVAATKAVAAKKNARALEEKKIEETLGAKLGAPLN
ncbi:MAG: hypothetical protein JST04_07665 [Bdellovibrionales bacterium]|nr:hypothetical protein [Bdellovibrionales bacterium]